jgi:serine/threonine-protein kinase
MSPEQARGEPVTAASDRYALAVIGFELLARRRPFQAADPFDEARAQTDAAVPRISDLAPLPAASNRVFERALAKFPGDRYTTAGEFVSVLAAALKPRLAESAPTVVAGPARQSMRVHPSSTGTVRSAGRGRWGLLGAIALLAAVLGLAAAYLMTRGADSKAGAPRVLTKIMTVQGATRTRVVTVRSTAPPPSTVTITASSSAAAPASTSGFTAPTTPTAHQLNDEGYALINRGRYADAVPLLQRAVAALRRTGRADPYNAYANYNLGYALLQLGRCRAAIPPLKMANRLETARSVDTALARARACA